MGLRFFCGHARLALQMSTVIRMNYLCQPIAGLLFITVNFFQDGSQFSSCFVQADITLINICIYLQHQFFNLAFVPSLQFAIACLYKC